MHVTILNNTCPFTPLNVISLVCLYLGKILFSDVLQFKRSFVRSQNNPKDPKDVIFYNGWCDHDECTGSLPAHCIVIEKPTFVFAARAQAVTDNGFCTCDCDPMTLVDTCRK